MTQSTEVEDRHNTMVVHATKCAEALEVGRMRLDGYSAAVADNDQGASKYKGDLVAFLEELRVQIFAPFSTEQSPLESDKVNLRYFMLLIYDAGVAIDAGAGDEAQRSFAAVKNAATYEHAVIRQEQADAELVAARILKKYQDEQ